MTDALNTDCLRTDREMTNVTRRLATYRQGSAMDPTFILKRIKVRFT